MYTCMYIYIYIRVYINTYINKHIYICCSCMHRTQQGAYKIPSNQFG